MESNKVCESRGYWARACSVKKRGSMDGRDERAQFWKEKSELENLAI